jgi:hypothetical protein
MNERRYRSEWSPDSVRSFPPVRVAERSLSVVFTQTASAALFVFLVICVFDPVNTITGMKTTTFVVLWLITLTRLVMEPDSRARLPEWFVVYVSFFIAIPTLSVIWYFIHDGSAPFDGLSYMKAYLLLSLALILRINRIDLVPMLSGVLVPLAVAILVMFFSILIFPGLYNFLKPIGLVNGLFLLDWRSYGPLMLLQAFFVTSPMLVIPIAYYFDRAMSSDRKPLFFTLCAVCVAGMIAAGSRNNIFTAILLPAVLWPLYTKRPTIYYALSACVIGLMALAFLDQLRLLLDPKEFGNSVRLGLLTDYKRIFDDPYTLFVGRGLGAYEVWTNRPFRSFSELTYLDLIRYFGMPAGFVMVGLLVAPVALLWTAGTENRVLAIAWGSFLVMSFSNPLIFSSVGIVVLTAVLARVEADVILDRVLLYIDERRR